jgi:hypothetical protein
MSDSDPIEQQLADWFAVRLARVKEEDGYSLTLPAEHIYTDGSIPQRQAVSVPYAAYDDDDGIWDNPSAGDKSSFKEMYPIVYLMVGAGANDYRKVSRKVWRDVSVACAFNQINDTDTPKGVVAIFPTSWSRQEREGRYLEVAISFVVRAASSFVIPPVP